MAGGAPGGAPKLPKVVVFDLDNCCWRAGSRGPQRLPCDRAQSNPPPPPEEIVVLREHPPY